MLRISKATTTASALLMSVHALNHTKKVTTDDDSSSDQPNVPTRFTTTTHGQLRGRTSADRRNRSVTTCARDVTTIGGGGNKKDRMKTSMNINTEVQPRTRSLSRRSVTTKNKIERANSEDSYSSDDVVRNNIKDKASSEVDDDLKDKKGVDRLVTQVKRLATQAYDSAKNPSLDYAEKQTRALTHRLASLALENDNLKELYADDTSADLEESKESLGDYLYGGVYGIAALIRGIITPIVLVASPILFFGLLDEVQTGEVLTTGTGWLLLLLAIANVVICCWSCQCAREERIAARHMENKDSEFDNTRFGGKCCFERCAVGRDLLVTVCFDKLCFVCFGLREERKNNGFAMPWLIGMILGMCLFIYTFASTDMLLHPLHCGQEGYNHVAPAVEAQHEFFTNYK